MNKEKPKIQILFGENVRKYRKKNGLTQEQFSEQLGISQKHLSIIETGTQFASAFLIEKIAAAFKVPPARLFGDEINTEEINVITKLVTLEIQRAVSIIDSRLLKIEEQLDKK